MKHEWPIETLDAPSPNEIIRILREARAIVAEGWCKGVAEDGQGNHCALGALALAAPRERVIKTIIPILNKALPKSFSFGTIACYNDSLSTTQADILALFDRAIEITNDRR